MFEEYEEAREDATVSFFKSRGASLTFERNFSDCLLNDCRLISRASSA